MPHRSTIRAPTIVPLAKPIPGYPTTHLCSGTRIELQTTSPNCRIYFTTDGTDPDPFTAGIKGPGQTFRYKNPFKLKPGIRTVQAVAVHLTRRDQSAVVSKTFTIGEGDGSFDDSGSLNFNNQVHDTGYNSFNIDSYLGGQGGRSYSVEDDSLEKYFAAGDDRVSMDDLYLSGGSDVETEVSNIFRGRGTQDGRMSRRSYITSPISSRGDGLTDLYIADLEITPRHAYGGRGSYPSDLETLHTPRTVRFSEQRGIDLYPSPHSEFTQMSSIPQGEVQSSRYVENEHPCESPVLRSRSREQSPIRYVEGQGIKDSREYSQLRSYSPSQVIRDHGFGLSSTRGYTRESQNSVSNGYRDHYPAITPRLQSEYDRQVEEEMAKLRAERPHQERYSFPHDSVWVERERERIRQDHSFLSRPRSRSPSPTRPMSPSRYPMNLPPDLYRSENDYTAQTSYTNSRERHSRADEREEILRRRREQQLFQQGEVRRLEQRGRVYREEKFDEKHEDEAKEKQDSPEKGKKSKSEKKKGDKKDKNKKKKKRDESSSSSSSSSTLSLDSVLHSNEKASKSKVKSHRSNTVKAVLKKIDKKSFGEQQRDKTLAERHSKNGIKTEVPLEITPRDIKLDTDRKKSGLQDGNRGRTLQSSDGGLNFINDSGTQINFWGTTPDEVMQQVLNKQVKGLPNVLGTKDATQRSKQDNDSVNLDDFFGTSSRPGSMVSSSGSSTLQLAPDIPVKNVSQRGMLAASTGQAVKHQTQLPQEGFVDSCKKFFKGWGSNSKKSNKESRPTVKDLNCHIQDVGSRKTISYESERSKSLKSGQLFEDPDFPATDSSIYIQNRPSIWPIEWKRPHEICRNPKMFVGGASRFDINQGVLGNCWFLAAVASLTTDKTLFYRVVPKDQTFDKGYAGIFRFEFWQYGHWVEVIVDDQLPTSKGRLIYMHSEDNDEFWSPLLEKACAKLCGCYENMSSGLTSEAMTDFTGGVCERFNFREELPFNMFQILVKARERRALMGCSIDADPGQMEAKLDNGLVLGHAYSITDVKQMSDDVGNNVELVRVRNPWGNECEWNGSWSDKSEEWQSLSASMKEELGLNFDHDGEFWMSFLDFSTHFQRVEICNLGPDSAQELALGQSATSWNCHVIEGSWKKKVNAGGCRNHRATYHSNPHYRVTLTDVDDDDDEVTLIVGLMQKGRRINKMGNLTIGYDIYKVEGSWLRKKTLNKSFFRSNSCVSTSAYINMREVCQRHRLSPGEYVIVPTTFAPNEEADFIIRTFTEKDSELVEDDEETCAVQASATSVVHSAPEEHLASEAEAEFSARSGEDQEIDAHELRNILNTVFAKGFDQAEFDTNICRSLIALRDVDHTGMLGLLEFKDLWHELKHWKIVYQQYDLDQSGHFNSMELREAVKSVGYQTSNATFNVLVMRYSDRDGFVRFDDFVACIVKLKAMFEIFQQKATGDSSIFDRDEFIQMTMYS